MGVAQSFHDDLHYDSDTSGGDAASWGSRSRSSSSSASDSFASVVDGDNNNEPVLEAVILELVDGVPMSPTSPTSPTSLAADDDGDVESDHELPSKETTAVDEERNTDTPGSSTSTTAFQIMSWSTRLGPETCFDQGPGQRVQPSNIYGFQLISYAPVVLYVLIVLGVCLPIVRVDIDNITCVFNGGNEPPYFTFANHRTEIVRGCNETEFPPMCGDLVGDDVSVHEYACSILSKSSFGRQCVSSLAHVDDDMCLITIVDEEISSTVKTVVKADAVSCTFWNCFSHSQFVSDKDDYATSAQNPHNHPVHKPRFVHRRVRRIKKVGGVGYATTGGLIFKAYNVSLCVFFWSFVFLLLRVFAVFLYGHESNTPAVTRTYFNSVAAIIVFTLVTLIIAELKAQSYSF